MNAPKNDSPRRIVFVSRAMSGESLRVVRAIRKLERVCLLGICEQPILADAAEEFVDLLYVGDTHEAAQLICAAQTLTGKHGALDYIVTTQEFLLEPVAQAVASLGLSGLSVDTVRRALDKSRLKQILAQAGLRTARDRVITDKADAWGFASDVGLPIVLKPLGGSGGMATWCIRNPEELELALELMQPSDENAVLAEDYLRGQELCIDTITIANEPRFHSICCYRPSILEALENSGIQWSCLMPRDITGERYHEFTEQGLAAVRALSVENAMTHMEGFLVDGGGVCFTDATLRPAGARIGPMLAYAYDIDPYLAWARVALDGCFDGPWERKYAVGTIFLRGSGSGTVEDIEGMGTVTSKLESLLVEVRLPRAGTAKSATYTGDGYITVRHPETQAVEEALDFISETVRITYSNSEAAILHSADAREQWERRLQYSSKELNKPAWDNDFGPAVSQ
jgi:biotin carboxylase